MRPPSKPNAAIAGISLAATAAVAFGTLAIFGKLAYRDGADSLPLLSLRFLLASVLLGIVLVATRRPATPSRGHLLRLIGLGAVGYGFEASLFFAALERAPAAVVGLVFYSYPLWTSVIAFTMGLERFRLSLLVALALGLAGVAIVFSSPLTGVAGPLLALAAALAVAVYFIAIQFATSGVDPIASALWTSVGAAGSTGVAALVTQGSLPAAALDDAAALALASAVAFVLLYAAIARIGSARSSIAAMLEPITTVLLAAALLDEVISWRIAAGAALVIAALPVLATAGDETPVAVDPLP